MRCTSPRRWIGYLGTRQLLVGPSPNQAESVKVAIVLYSVDLA
jgi:hypothetical protein